MDKYLNSWPSSLWRLECRVPSTARARVISDSASCFWILLAWRWRVSCMQAMQLAGWQTLDLMALLRVLPRSGPISTRPTQGRLEAGDYVLTNLQGTALKKHSTLSVCYSRYLIIYLFVCYFFLAAFLSG